MNPFLLFSSFFLEVVLEEAALSRWCEVPVCDQGWRPACVETPYCEGDALLLEVLCDVVSVNVSRDYRDVRSELILKAESDFCADYGIFVGNESEVSFPLLLPWLLALHRIWM